MINKDALVRVKDYIPDIYVDLPYSRDDNFTGKRLYTFKDAYLRYGTVLKLKAAQEYVRKHGASIMILDAYRPAVAQFIMWEVMPDDDFVADPRRGFSKHTRGSTVDVTLVTPDGNPVPMPSPFDDFSGGAKRVYDNTPEDAKRNILLLEAAMEQAGFWGYVNEWWHFNDHDIYPVLEEPEFELV
ncbi:MAG: M15 family metallopeptidase [Clostridia bacterium]|nr:M15 family metallopeptidase [Clostridia bacterium]